MAAAAFCLKAVILLVLLHMCPSISWVGLWCVIAAFYDRTRWFSDHTAYVVFMSWLSFVMSICEVVL